MPDGRAPSQSQDRVGDQFFELRNFPAALAAYQASLSIRERLVKADPGNAGWQINLSGSHHRIGEVLYKQGNFLAALAAYQASLSIKERLAEADPGNAGWQRELAWTHWRVGEALARQGARGDAVSAFERGRVIIVRLRQLSPDDATVREDSKIDQGCHSFASSVRQPLLQPSACGSGVITAVGPCWQRSAWVSNHCPWRHRTDL